MSDSQAEVTTIPASEVRVGDVVRSVDGIELTVSRIEDFMFEGMITFIEDTDVKWFKMLARLDDEITLVTRTNV